jgi:MFS family permease
VIASLGQEFTYLFNAISFLVVLVALVIIGPVEEDHRQAPGIHLRAALDGIRFIVSKPIIFSTMLMDFVATFFVSANTMMPIVAKDILQVGEIGYGWLSAAQSVGSVGAGVVLSQVPKLRRQGPIFLGAVTMFGLCAILFGLSPQASRTPLAGSPFHAAFLLAFVALVLVGAADAVSTIIRNTIRQLNTPDHLRGRMVAVNQIFFQGGPQLGEVEAGLVASLFGVPFAVVSGGIACLIGVALIALKWPELHRYNGDEYLKERAAAG